MDRQGDLNLAKELQRQFTQGGGGGRRSGRGGTGGGGRGGGSGGSGIPRAPSTRGSYTSYQSTAAPSRSGGGYVVPDPRQMHRPNDSTNREAPRGQMGGQLFRERTIPTGIYPSGPANSMLDSSAPVRGEVTYYMDEEEARLARVPVTQPSRGSVTQDTGTPAPALIKPAVTATATTTRVAGNVADSKDIVMSGTEGPVSRRASTETPASTSRATSTLAPAAISSGATAAPRETPAPNAVSASRLLRDTQLQQAQEINKNGQGMIWYYQDNEAPTPINAGQPTPSTEPTRGYESSWQRPAMNPYQAGTTSRHAGDIAGNAERGTRQVHSQPSSHIPYYSKTK